MPVGSRRKSWATGISADSPTEINDVTTEHWAAYWWASTRHRPEFAAEEHDGHVVYSQRHREPGLLVLYFWFFGGCNKLGSGGITLGGTLGGSTLLRDDKAIGKSGKTFRDGSGGGGGGALSINLG